VIVVNIGAVSSNSNANITPVKNDNIISELEKVKAKLQEQIQKTNESKIDDKIKKERIDELKEQIQQIDMQIQEIQSERLNKNQKKAEQEASNNTQEVNSVDSVSFTVVSDLEKVSATYSQAKIINNIKKGFDSKAKILKNEIKLDADRRHDDNAKKAELSKIQLKGRTLSKKLGDSMEKVQNEVKEAAEKASKYSSQEDSNDENLQLRRHKKVDIVV
jgi:hypothetical protein